VIFFAYFVGSLCDLRGEKLLTAQNAKGAKKIFGDWQSAFGLYILSAMKKEQFFEVSQLEKQREQTGKAYLEFLRIPAMSAGVYTLPEGGVDPQKPHREDEMYYVVRGRAHMRVGSEDREINAGSVIFVAAWGEHQFHDIVEELVVLVFFAPAES
jgi:mannose-6-phosphate isomerase-like protein (cupin superfamily)